MWWTVSLAAAGWTTSDLAQCEAMDRAACERLLEAEVREIARTEVTGAFMDHLHTACLAGVTWSCVAHPSIEVYAPACGSRCPKATSSPTRLTVLRDWTPIAGSAVASDSDTLWGPDERMLAGRTAPIMALGEAGGDVWLGFNDGTPLPSMVRVDHAGATSVSLLGLPAEPSSVRFTFGGEQPAVSGTASGVPFTGLFDRDGRVELLSPPSPEARLVAMAGSTRLWSTKDQFVRERPGREPETIDRLGGEKAHLSVQGDVLLLHDALRLWETSGIRELRAAGRPVGVAWDPKGRDILAHWDGRIGTVDRRGRVKQLAIDLVKPEGTVLALQGGASVAWPYVHGAPPPLPDWVVTGLAAAARLAPAPTNGFPEGASDIFERRVGFGPEAAFRLDGEQWTRFPLSRVDVVDDQGRPVSCQRIEMTHPAKVANLMWPWCTEDLRIPEAESNGAVRQADGSWRLVIPTPPPVALSPLTAPRTGVYKAANPARRRTEVQPIMDVNVLQEAGRWLVLSNGQKREPFRLAFRLSDDEVWMMNLSDQEAFVYRRSPF